mmetsp:Transcript_19078/g.28192  ORF Transcript_19078/g.28192 Transcript_19078/m.28192 type:complete len:125 (+) Transcript_19078:55-429(+)
MRRHRVPKATLQRVLERTPEDFQVYLRHGSWFVRLLPMPLSRPGYARSVASRTSHDGSLHPLLEAARAESVASGFGLRPLGSEAGGDSPSTVGPALSAVRGVGGGGGSPSIASDITSNFGRRLR